jgi:hypothetical protein
MKIARVTKAPMMPQKRTRCCSWRGIFSRPKMTRKTNRLSMLRLFSTR